MKLYFGVTTFKWLSPQEKLYHGLTTFEWIFPLYNSGHLIKKIIDLIAKARYEI